MTEVKKPSDLPKAKKHKPMDSEDDEEPQNEPGTSSNSSATSPTRTSCSQGPSTSSEDESADNDDDHGDVEFGPAIQSARSYDSGRTVLYPDLYVLTNGQ